MQTFELAGMDALLWVAMFIGLWIGYILSVKLPFNRVVEKKGTREFAKEFAYTFVAISVVFVSLLVCVVSWINEINLDYLFAEVSLGNLAILGAVSALFSIIFQNQIKLKVETYLEQGKSSDEVISDLKEAIDDLSNDKSGL